MAKIIETSIDTPVVGLSYSLVRNALIGAVLGLIYYVLVELILNFNSSIYAASGIATILVGTLGILIMARLYMPQIFMINLAVGISLWGLGQWTDGLGWFEVLSWSVLLYGLSYVLFSWLARFTKAIPVMISVTVIVVAVRIAAAL